MRAVFRTVAAPQARGLPPWTKRIARPDRMIRPSKSSVSVIVTTFVAGS
jgi:hypothetical protein